jgi:hypothetical protein
MKEALPPKKKKKQNKNNPHFQLADELQRITGVNLTRIDGVDVFVAQSVTESQQSAPKWNLSVAKSLSRQSIRPWRRTLLETELG